MHWVGGRGGDAQGEIGSRDIYISRLQNNILSNPQQITTTGDQAEVDEQGNWRIIGRVKSLLVPTSGHNVAPEPIEQAILQAIDGVEQAVVFGHARPFLTALIHPQVFSQLPQPALNVLLHR